MEEKGKWDLNIYLHGVVYPVNMRCMASRSAKIAMVLETRPQEFSFLEIPADAKAFELVERFCHGQSPELSPETVVPLACVASYLGMTEEHSPGNLLSVALAFFSSRVLPHWSETLRALRSAEPVMPHARRLGLVDACLRSIAEKALADPRLLGSPTEVLPTSHGSHNSSSSSRVCETRRRLFPTEHCCPEDLTGLPLDLYAMAMSAVAGSGVPAEQVALCLYTYAKKRAHLGCAAPPQEGEQVGLSEYENNSRRRVVEAVEKLLPHEKGSLHIKPLFQLLQSANFLRASEGCRDGLEARIGKVLAAASLHDLLIPSFGYAIETQHDVECVKRILIHFCSHYYASPDASELVAVTELFQGFVAEVAGDAELRKEAFTSLLERLAGMLELVGRGSDGVYRAVDMYLDAHGDMTESEREEVCRALDCGGMSLAACEHAALNERMPLRVVAAALFFGQVRIREAVADAMGGACCGERSAEPEEVKGKGKKSSAMDASASGESAAESESTRSGSRRETEMCRRCGGIGHGMARKKLGFWKGLKRRLGCGNSGSRECNCQVKPMEE